MVTTIKERNGVLYCANCRMRVKSLRFWYCQFCGYEFANWEQIAIEYEKERENYDRLCGDDR
jgi:ribosomal protein L37AE/L43A